MSRANSISAKVALAGICAMLWVTQARAADWAAANSARVDALVTHFMRPRRTGEMPPPPSLSLAVGIDGGLVLAKGYGEARPGSSATERTVYHIGSLTKQFTAAAVLALIEQGTSSPISGAPVGLDTRMSDIFSDVHAWTTHDEPPITVRSLLNMTSNLPNFTRRPPPDTDPWGAVPAPRLLDALKKISPHGWPNSFEYSNTSYFLLAQIIAASRGMNPKDAVAYRDYIRAVTIDKVGMPQTGFVGDYAPGSDLAAAHYRRRPAFAMPDWLNGSGDMASNVVDIFAWNRALINGQVLSRASLDAMFGDGGRVGPFTYYGMGWFVEHEGGWDTYFHSGSVPGYTSYNAILKRQGSSHWISVTLLTNSDGVEGLDQLAGEIVDLVRAKASQ